MENIENPAVAEQSASESVETTENTSETAATEEETQSTEVDSDEGSESEEVDAQSEDSADESKTRKDDSFYAERRRREKAEKDLAKIRKDLGLDPEVKAEASESTSLDEDSKTAIEQLKANKDLLRQAGLVFQEDLDVKSQQDAVVQEAAKLTEKYNGSDGKPKFETAKVAAFGKKHSIFDLEAAYKLLNEAEIIDWAIKQAKSKPSATEVSDSAGATNQGAKPMSWEEFWSLPKDQQRKLYDTMLVSTQQ